jgi:hypothetical protein
MITTTGSPLIETPAIEIPETYEIHETTIIVSERETSDTLVTEMRAMPETETHAICEIQEILATYVIEIAENPTSLGARTTDDRTLDPRLVPVSDQKGGHHHPMYRRRRSSREPG